MIVKRYWQSTRGKYVGQFRTYNCMGIFLLGFIPLYIRRSDNIRRSV